MFQYYLLDWIVRLFFSVFLSVSFPLSSGLKIKPAAIITTMTTKVIVDGLL